MQPLGGQRSTTPAPLAPTLTGDGGGVLAVRPGGDEGSEALTPETFVHVRNKGPWEPLSHLSRK